MTEFIDTMLRQIIDRENILRAELRKLKEAKAALRAVDSNSTQSKSAKKPKDKPSNKDMILTVLKNAESGLNIDGIANQIKEKFDVSIMRQTISPTLTRLKNDNEIQNWENGWYHLTNLVNDPLYKSYQNNLAKLLAAPIPYDRDVDFELDSKK